ncbi:MAG: GNAT family N-acetyltransferase [Muribaculaceae bacterium]|nr:GNAT family N-acetyltransferase [Muribaculaceae bacterium]
MKIANASPEDASLIADAILAAVGDEISDGLAGDRCSREDVHDLFMRLASRKDTQYSYTNARIARTDSGRPMGVCVSYDGAELKRLRVHFFHEACTTLGWKMTSEEMDNFPGETDSDEFYLDTLMVLPEFRGQGIGRALIDDARNRARAAGKPLGLLCDKDNVKARHLYESCGFRCMGERLFAGTVMDHLQIT